MYRKDSDRWLKHADFILLDMICLQIAFVLAYITSGYGWNPYEEILYRNMAIFIELVDVVGLFLSDLLKGVLKTECYHNFIITVRHAVLIGALAILYLFLLQQSNFYSRKALILTFLFYIWITFGIRELRKKMLRRKMADGDNRSLLIVTSSDDAETVVKNVKENNYARYTLAGIAVIDEDWQGREILGIPVVANEKTVPDYICKKWIDEVLVAVSDRIPYPDDLVEKVMITGVTVHQMLARIISVPGKKQFVEKVGNYAVLTTSMNYASSAQLFAKRLIDIIGSVIGCLFTCVIFIFVAPVIYINSPGPIIFAQERVGKNGKPFKMYKFRSMYMDAEERKSEFMKDNKMGDGKMFKLDFDPRVIGNKILPDGTKKKGIGDFIRRTSLDEFPQFFNVLKGDMSIVGTRPPLLSETSLYELHHRARLAIKPGITGLWQVSGRSDIIDFEEVVRLDTEYIRNWNLGLDLKILIKTVPVVFRRDGSA